MATLLFKVGDKVRVKDNDEKKKYFPDIYVVTNVTDNNLPYNSLITIADSKNRIINQLFDYRLEHLPKPRVEDDPEYREMFI